MKQDHFILDIFPKVEDLTLVCSTIYFSEYFITMIGLLSIAALL